MFEILKAETEALLERYRESLAACRLTCEISKKYFEMAPEERDTTSDRGLMGLFALAERHLDKKREKKKKYNFIRNRYHCVILRFSPSETGLIAGEPCKEYAFMIMRKDRPHVGEAPTEKIYAPEKVTEKIEKRIKKMLLSAKSPYRLPSREARWEAPLLHHTRGQGGRAAGRDTPKAARIS